MDVFCHPLSKPAGSLHVKVEGNELDLTVVLRDRVLTAEVSLDANPQAKQLLEPCDSVAVILQRNKVTVVANGEDVIRNTPVEQTDNFRDALIQISKSFCKLSRTHAETISKRREARDAREEAFECLKKIEQQHQEDFTKFILILNEKKKKIRELQRKLGIRTDDPEDIEDDIGVEVLDDGPSQSKKSKVSDQLALEDAPASSTKATTEGEDDGDHDGGNNAAEDVDDEELLSDEEHTDGAQSEVEEIEEDDPPEPEASPMSTEKQGPQVEGEETAPMEEKVKEEKMSSQEDKDSETDPPSPGRDMRRSNRRDASSKKCSLDLLDDLL